MDYFIGNELARKKITKKLGFDFDYDERSQDWEYEVSHLGKTEDYLELYNLKETTNDEKKSLMEMIIDSIEDKYHNEQKNVFNKYRNFILDAIKNNLDIHKGTLVYWIQSDFLISKKLKEIIKELKVEKKIAWKKTVYNAM